MHENFRSSLPLLAKVMAVTNSHDIRQRTKIVWRYNYQHFHSERVVKPWPSRHIKTHDRAWANGSRTFIHLACGINHKVNAWL